MLKEGMDREALEKLTKDELVDLVLKIQRPAKTSQTSSKPPSTDRKAKRENAKPGGAKPGHQGHARSLCETPNKVVEHRPELCEGCGLAFTVDTPGEVIGGYDAIDIPPIQPFVERHTRLSCACLGCGAVTKAGLPEAAAGTPFGPNIRTLAFYFKHMQHVSYARLQAMFRDVFGLTISQGALCNLLERDGALFATEREKAVARLRLAEAVASDETGVRIEGTNAQHWVFRALEAVVHHMAFSRAGQVVRDMMNGAKPSFWLSDRYSAQQKHGERHQTCLAHLARDAARVLEVGDEATGLSLKLWFKDALALAKEIGVSAESTIKKKHRDLDQRIDALLARTSDCDVTAKVLRKIANARDQLLTFLDAPPGLVEPTNNGCERSLRHSVVTEKVTNGFRSFWGAEGSADVLTTVDNDRLQGQNPYQAIKRVIHA